MQLTITDLAIWGLVYGYGHEWAMELTALEWLEVRGVEIGNDVHIMV